MHNRVADGEADDQVIKQAGEALSNAQALYTELGELAQVRDVCGA